MTRRYDDPELAELFEDSPDLVDLARVAQSRELDVPMSDAFPRYLRARLMDEAEHRLRPRGLGRLRRALTARGALALTGSAAGAVMVGIAVFSLAQHTGDSTVVEPSASVDVGGRTNLDPTTHAFTVAFNTTMDQGSVVRAIHIEPATSFSTAWSGNTLTITPTHGLTASTGYVVRIDNTVARSSSGQAPKAPIVVAFGTKPTPTAGPGGTPTPAPAPTLTPVVLGTVTAGADALPVPVPGGGLLVTAVDQPAQPGSTASSSTSAAAASSSGSSSTAPSASAATSSASSAVTTVSGATGQGSATGALTAGSSTLTAPAGGLYRFGSGLPVRVGPAATAAAVSPTGRYVAAVETAGGTTSVVLENIDSTQRRVLARADAGSPVAWTGSSSVVYLAGGRLRSVDLQGGIRAIGPSGGIAVARDATLLLAPGARVAYISTPSVDPVTGVPAAGGHLVDLATGATLTLPGSGSLVAFATDGGGVAWVDGTAAAPQVDLLTLGSALPSSAAPGSTLTPAGAGRVTALAVAPAGSAVAMSVDAGAAHEVRILDSTGHVVATSSGSAERLAFLDARTLALVTTDHAATASIPGAAPPAAAVPGVPAEAQHLLDGLVAAQIGDRSPLATIPAAAGIDLAALTPAGVTQGYVVAIAPRSSADAPVVAAVRLVSVSAGSGAPVSFADEQVTIDRTAAGTYQVTQLTSTPLSPEPLGPHVVHVVTQRSATALTVTVSFDSDLDPASVAGALSITGPGSAAAPLTQNYDAASRTVTLTAPLPIASGDLEGPLTLHVSTGLRDVDGNALAGAYAMRLSAG